MKHYAGLDVSLETTAICVLDADGQIESEISVVSHADDIFSALSPYSATLEAIGLEAGPLSEFLVRGLKTKGLQSILMETRRVHSALSAIPVKTDRKGACGIAHLLRMGWYQPVHLKAPAARDLRLQQVTILLSAQNISPETRQLDPNLVNCRSEVLILRMKNELKWSLRRWIKSMINKRWSENSFGLFQILGECGRQNGRSIRR